MNLSQQLFGVGERVQKFQGLQEYVQWLWVLEGGEILWRSGDQRHWASSMYEFCSNLVHVSAPSLEAFFCLQGGVIHLIGVSCKIGFLCIEELRTKAAVWANIWECQSPHALPGV